MTRSMRTSGILLLCAMVSNLLTAQGPSTGTLANRGCGTPTLPAQFETWLQGVTPKPGKGNTSQTQSVFNIPVIVHVIHNNESLNSTSATTGGNLNAAQIIDQINILNKDFNARNSDTNLIPSVFKPLKGNFQFNFCLAVVNPTGGVLTEPGINRISTTSYTWGSSPYTSSFITSTVKPATIWDPNRYLNMWVCSISGGVLGFATFPNPGTSGLSGFNPPYGSTTTDGLVMRNTAFGSIGTAAFGVYNKGRTATHELGHWLGLRHIWGDGTCATDYCADTPPAQNANFNCPTHPHKLGTCSGNTTGEMTMNYMDYTNDACMYMFSNDQKNRAQLIMTNSPMRAALLTSTVCNLPATTNELGVLYVISPTYSQVISCNNNISPKVKIHNFGSNTITSVTYSYNVDAVNTQTALWTGTLLPGTSATVNINTISNLANGSHTFNTGFYLPNGSADSYTVNNFNSQQFTIINSFTLGAAHSGAACPSSSSTLSASGGASGFTWTPGSLTGSQVTISPSAATVYTLSASNGSCVNTRTISVNVLALPVINVNSPTVCSGAPASLNASGACSYTWLPGNLSGATINVNPASTTQYTVFASGCNGCGASKAATVTVVANPVISIAASPAGSLCVGGSATLTAAGATSYSWSSGQTGNVIVVSPATNTSYAVTGSNGNCSATSSLALNVGSGSLLLSISPNPATVCAGSQLILTAGGANSYTWNTGSNSQSFVITPSVSTSYSLSGTNGACTATAATNVSVIPVPVVGIQSSAGTTVCAGASVTLTANGAASYNWSNGATGAQIVVSPSATANYSVAGSTNGCSNTQSIGITVGGSAGLSIVSSGTQVCAGTSVTLSVNGSGTYTWNNGATTSSIIVTPSVTSGYSVSGMQNGCTGNAATTVSVISAPLISVTALPAASICAGSTATLIASGSYSNFAWTPGVSPGASITVAPGKNSSYTVTGSGNPGGCSGTGTIQIVITKPPVSVLSSSNTICHNACSGALNVTTSGGLAPYSYSLSAGSCTSPPCSNLCQGLYTLKTTDSTGCSSINLFSIECDPNTGISEQNGFAQLLVTPNPAQESFIVNHAGKFEYSLYNELGQQVKTGISESGSCVVQVDNLAKGIYLLRVSQGESRMHRKVLVN